MWHQWFNRNFMKLWEYFLCAKKTKITTLFNNFFSSVSVFTIRSWEYHDTCVWCCWYRRMFIYHEKHLYALKHLCMSLYCKVTAEHHMNTAIQIRCLFIMWINLIWITRAQFVGASKVQATIQSPLHGINGSHTTSLKRLKIKFNPSCPLDWEWDRL